MRGRKRKIRGVFVPQTSLSYDSDKDSDLYNIKRKKLPAPSCANYAPRPSTSKSTKPPSAAGEEEMDVEEQDSSRVQAPEIVRTLKCNFLNHINK